MKTENEHIWDKTLIMIAVLVLLIVILIVVTTKNNRVTNVIHPAKIEPKEKIILKDPSTTPAPTTKPSVTPTPTP